MTCKNRRGFNAAIVFAVALCLSVYARAQEVSLRVPSGAAAGSETSIGTTGGGSATFYLIGPASATKHEVQLGQEIPVTGKEVQAAGRYTAVVCSGTCTSAEFFVTAAKPISLTFLAHPSRAPVGQTDAISGVALPFDQFGNLVLAPTTVVFQLANKGSAPSSHKVDTQGGVAWFRTNSGKSAGPLQLTASLEGLSARRVVQQVASEPCNLRIKSQRTAKGVVIETDPVRDCAGNPVPDGTIVTFTARNGSEVSTVDAPIKQDVARAQITGSGPLVVSAASGVVMGNELHVDGH